MGALLYHRPHRLLLDMGSSSSSPDTMNKTRGSYPTETNFDTNMVIILAALLCALICALGLNSLVRCALRCSHRFAFETPEEAAVRLAAKGLKKKALRQIPIAVYGSGAEVPATECPICLGEFVDGEKVRVLPNCNHGFHVRCIDTWLQSHSSCPTCRQSLRMISISRSSDTAAAAAGSSAAVTVAAEAGTRNNAVGNASGGPEHGVVNEVG